MKPKDIVAACALIVAGAIMMACSQPSSPPAAPAAKPAATPAATTAATTVATTAATPAAMAPTDWPAEAPATFKVQFETLKGSFVAEFHKDWSPLGVQRIYDLVKANFFDEARFFRVLPGFVVQFGMAADPAVGQKWEKNLNDEPVKQGNTRGRITFAKGGPNTRTTQLFINLGNNSVGSMNNLDAMGFPAVGEVTQGMDVVEKFDAEYGERASNQQPMIRAQGNAFLTANFPKLDYIKKTALMK